MKSWGHPWEQAGPGAIYYVCMAVARSIPDFLPREDIASCHRCGAAVWIDRARYREQCRTRRIELLVTCVRCANMLARRRSAH